VSLGPAVVGRGRAVEAGLEDPGVDRGRASRQETGVSGGHRDVLSGQGRAADRLLSGAVLAVSCTGSNLSHNSSLTSRR
jgi:hypothetical protein